MQRQTVEAEMLGALGFRFIGYQTRHWKVFILSVSILYRMISDSKRSSVAISQHENSPPF
ncbi:hypothetical protein GCM10007868_20310 [Gluconobacter frateurii]|nr:hypothetical protein GCM10007868_20310 [Gluconobacter frateurii]